MRLTAAAAVLGLSLSACGGGSRTTQCMGTVMGELMGTFSVCNEFDELYRQNLDTYSFTGAYTELPTSFTWSTDWELKGEPKARQYNQDTADLKCNVKMVKGGKIWVARKGAGMPASGTCVLTFADVTPDEPMGNVTTYKVKGNIAAQLEAQPGSGSTGIVNVAMTFCTGDGAYCPAMP